MSATKRSHCEENHFIVTVDDLGTIRVHNIKARGPSRGLWSLWLRPQSSRPYDCFYKFEFHSLDVLVIEALLFWLVITAPDFCIQELHLLRAPHRSQTPWPQIVAKKQKAEGSRGPRLCFLECGPLLLLSLVCYCSVPKSFVYRSLTGGEFLREAFTALHTPKPSASRPYIALLYATLSLNSPSEDPLTVKGFVFRVVSVQAHMEQEGMRYNTHRT